MVKKCDMKLRNKIFELTEKFRPEINTVYNKKKEKFESIPKSVTNNKKFVKYNNKLNNIDRCLGRPVNRATLSVNKKGIIKQIN